MSPSTDSFRVFSKQPLEDRHHPKGGIARGEEKRDWRGEKEVGEGGKEMVRLKFT